MGVYRQFSNNFHCYIDRPDVQRLIRERGGIFEEVNELQYERSVEELGPLKTGRDFEWSADLAYFFRKWGEGKPMSPGGFYDPLFSTVALPLYNAHKAYKTGDYELAETWLSGCEAWDWRLSATNWLQARKESKNRKEKANAKSDGT
jgi:hypothetical protein